MGPALVANDLGHRLADLQIAGEGQAKGVKAAHGRLDLDRLVSQRYPLDRINDALDAMLTGDVARTLIEF